MVMLLKIIGSKNVSPSLNWLSYAKTGKARAGIRRYWQNKTNLNKISSKEYISSLCIKNTSCTRKARRSKQFDWFSPKQYNKYGNHSKKDGLFRIYF